MLRWFTPLWLIALTIAAVVLFQVSYEVQEMEDELLRVERQIDQDREALQVLSAEWSYLNRPSRIAELSQRYLSLTPLEAGQIFETDQLPNKPEDLGFEGTRLTSLRRQADQLPLPAERPATPAGFLVKAPLRQDERSATTQIAAAAPAATKTPTKTKAKAANKVPPPVAQPDDAANRAVVQANNSRGGTRQRLNPVTGRPLPPLDSALPRLTLIPVSSGAEQ